jgi:hypothetical protein
MSVAASIPGSRTRQKPLGTMVWYAFGGPVEYVDGKRTVLPVTVSSADLHKWFDHMGLDEDQLPPEVRRVDKFRTVTSNARHRYDVTNGRAELYVEEISYDPEQVTRHVMRRVTLDGQQSSLDHVATLRFIRGGRTANQRRTRNDQWKPAILTRVKEPDRSEVEAFIERIRDEYDEGADGLDSTALRGVVRRYLNSLCGVPLRSTGGIYFVPAGHETTIAGLSEVIARIDSPGCSLDYIPYEGSDHHRSIVEQALASEIADTAGTIARAAEVRLRSASTRGKLAPTQYAELRERYAEAISTIECFEGLGVSVDVPLDAMTIAADKLAELDRFNVGR